MFRADGHSERVKSFTLVELMIVVTIVAILAMVALPAYASNVKASKMSEGVTGVGVIRTALRAYAAGHGESYPTLSGADGTGLSMLSISAEDLTGKYFAPEHYEVNSQAAGYTVRVTLPEDTSYWYEVDEEGSVSKNNF